MTKPFKVFHLTKEMWVRRRGKGEGGCGEIFHENCLSEYHFLFPDFCQYNVLCILFTQTKEHVLIKTDFFVLYG